MICFVIFPIAFLIASLVYTIKMLQDERTDRVRSYNGK